MNTKALKSLANGAKWINKTPTNNFRSIIYTFFH